MKGRLLPELVAGKLEELLGRLGDSAWQQMLLDLQFLSTSERCDLLRDFEIGRAHAVTALNVKFDFLRRLSWSLAVLAFTQHDVVRRKVLDIVVEFDKQDAEVQKLHHAKTLLFLDPAGPLRASLDLFCKARHCKTCLTSNFTWQPFVS